MFSAWAIFMATIIMAKSRAILKTGAMEPNIKIPYPLIKPTPRIIFLVNILNYIIYLT